jgi:hypothetical protein
MVKPKGTADHPEDPAEDPIDNEGIEDPEVDQASDEYDGNGEDENFDELDDTFIPVGDERLESLETQFNQLVERVDKQQDDQKHILVGAVVATAIAVLLVIAAISAEIIISNDKYNEALNEAQGQRLEDYKGIRDEFENLKDKQGQDARQIKQYMERIDQRISD